MEMERHRNENCMSSSGPSPISDGLFKGIGFEILYQESKNRRNSQNVSPDGMKSSVCKLFFL